MYDSKWNLEKRYRVEFLGGAVGVVLANSRDEVRRKLEDMDFDAEDLSEIVSIVIDSVDFYID